MKGASGACPSGGGPRFRVWGLGFGIWGLRFGDTWFEVLGYPYLKVKGSSTTPSITPARREKDDRKCNDGCATRAALLAEGLARGVVGRVHDERGRLRSYAALAGRRLRSTERKRFLRRPRNLRVQTARMKFKP